MVSLWGLNDYSVEKLTDSFYKNLVIDKMDKHEAFSKARRMVREEYPLADDWAGLVMVD